MEIFTNFLHVVGNFLVTCTCVVMVVCLFRKVSLMLSQCYEWLYNQGLILKCWLSSTFLASKVSQWKGQVGGKGSLSSLTKNNKRAYGVFEQWQKQRSIKVPNVKLVACSKILISIWFSRWIHLWSRRITGFLMLSSKNSIWNCCQHPSICDKKKPCTLWALNKWMNVITFSLENVYLNA